MRYELTDKSGLQSSPMPRVASPRPQAKSECTAATNQPDGQISKTLSIQLSIPWRKKILLPPSGKSVGLIRASRPIRGALRTSRNVAVGCGGRG